MSPRSIAARAEALAAEWEGFAREVRLDLDRFPPEERGMAEACAQVWLAAAQDLHRAMSATEAVECARCGRAELDPATFATQADAVRAAIEVAVTLGFAGPGGAFADADAYGGDTRRALLAALNRAADLALEYTRSSACHAGSCSARDTLERPDGRPCR